LFSVICQNALCCHFAEKLVLISGNSAVETQQHPQRKKERAASKKAYDYLVKSYNIHLCCDSCIEDQPVTDSEDYDSTANGCSNYYVRVRLAHTECHKNRLVLQEKQSNLKDGFSWIRIRACPSDFTSTSGICERFLNGEPCTHRNRCRFPHSVVEKELWIQYFNHTTNGSSITVDGFIDDLHNSSLRVRFEVEQMWQKLKALRNSALEFKLICRECWKKGYGEISTKRSHAPECQKGHSWNDKSKKLILAVGNERIIDLDRENDEKWTDEECNAVQAIQECRKRFSELEVTDMELISEVNRLKKQDEQLDSAELDQRRHLLDEHWEHLFNDDDDSTSGSYSCPDITVDDESQIDIEEDLSQIYADDELDDIMTICSSDLDSSDDEAFAEDPYYQLKSVTEARHLLTSQPNKYKRCLIHLDGPFSAKCRMLDEGFIVPRVPREDPSVSSEGDDVIREVEIRGRANCGPCFDGDEVVVELKKTKELDGDKVIYRGTVIAVLAKKILRKAYTFVCRVDTFHSHLMKPLDGVAPKIHVVNSILKKKYKDRKDELVAVYSMVNKNLKLQKIVKLCPQQRRDMLFVVK